jgi:hypothetical protein
VNRIGSLTLLGLFLVIGIVSCKSSEPIPTDMLRKVDFMIIWFEGKSIKLEKGNSNFDELSIEAQRGVLYGSCPAKISVIDSIRQNEKCLEIVYKDPHPMFKDNPDYVEYSKLLPLSKEPTDKRYIIYVEHSNGLGNSNSWSEFWYYKSPAKLVKMVDKILGVAH